MKDKLDLILFERQNKTKKFQKRENRFHLHSFDRQKAIRTCFYILKTYWSEYSAVVPNHGP